MKKDSYVAATRRDGSAIPYLFERNGFYYSLFCVGRKHVRRKCPFNGLKLAEAWVKGLRKELLGHGKSATAIPPRARSEWPTVDEVCEAYMSFIPERYALVRKPSDKTARTNVWMFKRLLSDLHKVGDVGILRVGHDLLTDQSSEKFMLMRQSAAGAKDALLADRARVSAASLLGQARSLFAKWARPKYRAAGINLPPSLLEWAESVSSSKPAHYARPPESLIDKTMAEVKGKPFFNAFALCYYFGLRRNEALFAHKSWVVPYEADFAALRIPLVDEYGWRGSKTRTARVIPAVKDVWHSMILKDRIDHLILGNNKTEREEHLQSLSDWMRSIGWDRRRYPHPLHELRKLAGSKWCQKVGAQQAAAWLGDTLQVTLHYYVDVIGQEKPVEM